MALFLAGRGRCGRCGAVLQSGWHADHVVARRAAGETVPANGMALCATCNLRKGGRLT